MVLYLLIPGIMTIVNLILGLINSLHADGLQLHDKLTLCLRYSLASVTACRCCLECSTIGCVMHGLAVCLKMVQFPVPLPELCIYSHIVLIIYSHTIITCSQYNQECPPFQDAPFPTTPEGLQSVCSLSLIAEQRSQSYQQLRNCVGMM